MCQWRLDRDPASFEIKTLAPPSPLGKLSKSFPECKFAKDFQFCIVSEWNSKSTIAATAPWIGLVLQSRAYSRSLLRDFFTSQLGQSCQSWCKILKVPENYREIFSAILPRIPPKISIIIPQPIISGFWLDIAPIILQGTLKRISPENSWALLLNGSSKGFS